ncbi:MAG: phosphate ABC transporter permease PstA [Chloroflexia bacterium]
MNATQTMRARGIRGTSARTRARRRATGAAVYIFTGLCTLIALGLLLYLLLFLLFRGVGALNLDFFTKEAAAVGEEGGGIIASLTGTAIIVAIAALIAVPMGLMVAIYLAEVARPDSWFANVARLAVNTFTGIPSIIVGVFVYITVVKPMASFSALAGGIALAIIMVPIVARTAEDVVRLVPGSIREAGLALGVPSWRVVMGLTLPAARAGIVTGCVLAVARVAGETAPLILTALGNEFVQTNIFKPTDELTLRILKYARGPYETWHQQAFGAAFVLVIGVAIGALLLRLATRGRGIKVQ